MSAGDIVAIEPRPQLAGRPQSISIVRSMPARPGRIGGRYYPLMIVLAAVCSGIGADRCAWRIVPQTFELWWCVSAIALCGWMFLWRCRRIPVAMAALGIALAAAGGAWHHASWNLFRDDELGRFAREAPQPICLEAVALSAPREIPPQPFTPLQAIRPQAQSRLMVQAVAIRNGTSWRTASGIAPMSVTGELTDVGAGDRLRIFGHFFLPEPAGNPGEFDYAVQDRGNRELAVIHVKQPACVAVVERGSPWNARRWIDLLRERCDALLWSNLKHDRASLAAAVLLGEREQVDRETNEAFVDTGTIHILCVAGLHVGIVAWLLFLALRGGWMPRRMALACVMAITGGYMLLTHAEPPVVRATLLVWIVCGALWIGRRGIGLNSLALAGLIIVAANPASLFRTGVHLSFLSVASLMTVAALLARHGPTDPLDRLIAATRPWPQRWLRKRGEYFGELFIAGVAVWLVVSPLVMARFHVLSLAALVLNVLLIPVVTVAMAAGLGVLAFGWWLPPLAAVCGWVCDWNLSLLNWVVKSADRVPGSHWWVVGPGEWWLAVFYAALAAAVFMPRWIPPARWRVALVAGWCGVGLLAAMPPRADPESLKCTFIAVGHGGGEFLELPDGRTLLYDAGRMGAPWGAARSISAYLWSRGITHLDAVVISHADSDHYNALPELLERFSVGVIYVSPVMFEKPAGGLKVLRQSIEQSGTKLEYLYAGDRLLVGNGATIDVLHPPPQGVVGRDNANCVVLAVEFAGRHILLTGDLEPPGLELVTNGEPFACDVLQIPHHGSTHSEPDEVANWTTPKWAFIAGGSGDGLLTRPVYEAHGATVLNTAQCGAITAAVDSTGLSVQCFRPIDLTVRSP